MKARYIDKSFYKIAGQVLKKKREDANLSLSQLADKMRTKTSKQNLSFYETGYSRIKIETFLDICLTLGLDPQEVIDEINMKHLKNAKIYKGENND